MNEPKLSERRLDELLDAAAVPDPDPHLMRRVAEIPLRESSRGRAAKWWPFAGFLAPLSAWGAAAVLGLSVGLWSAPEGTATDGEASDDATSEAASLDATDDPLATEDEMERWAALAFAYDLDEAVAGDEP